MTSTFAQDIPSRGSLVLRRRLLSRLLGFVLLELAFISLAIACLAYELPCSLSSSPTLTKAAFTVLFIAWQTLAIMCASEIVVHAFSSEWYFCYLEKGKLIPGYTDLVSTINSRFRDRLHHCVSRAASPAFRLSYLASGILFALSGVAPSSINVDDVPRFSKTTLAITNFTATGGDTDGILKDPITFTSTIVELESRENTPFGLVTQEHIVVGWPNIEAGQLTGDMKYASDALLYNMSCRWEAPSFNNSRWNTTWYAGGFAWYPWTTPDPARNYDGGLMPMFRFSTDQDFLPDNFPLPLPAVNPVGFSGYLFFGHNSSVRGTQPEDRTFNRTFNLDDLPTTFSETGFPFVDFGSSASHFTSPLASFLLCDPTARILDGKVYLSREKMSLTLESATPIKDKPIIGNISPDAANVILGLSLMDALENDDEKARIRVGALASKTFLNDTLLDFSSTETNSFDFGILPLEQIQRNLNQFMQSGSKALSSHTQDFDGPSPKAAFVVSVDGSIQQVRQVLTGSHGFVVATICLFFTTTLALVFNLFSLHIWKIPSFKLEALLHVIQEHGIQEDSEKEYRSQSHIPETGRPKTRSLLLRLLGFIILEVVFLSLVLVCSRTPIIINVSFSSAEVKGGFTIVFIIWQGVAIFFLSDAISFAFSSEWSLHFKKTKRLIPGESDRVSRLTSGNDDRIRYFLTKKPSATFYIAFLCFTSLTALNSFAPGTLSVSQVKTKTSTPLRVADLRFVNSSQDDGNIVNLNFLRDRADTSCSLELHEGFTFRYEMEPNWLMAWPDQGSIDPTIAGTIEYPTDVIHFNYSCGWRVPEMGLSDDGATTWHIDGQIWELWSDPLSEFLYLGGVLPLYRYLDVQPDDHSAFLVVGTNDSFPVDPDEDKRSIINLNHLPTLSTPSGLTLNSSDAILSRWVSPLSTILYCDPQTIASGGYATLSPEKTLNISSSGLPSVGNIPHDTITTIFTSALLEVLDTADETDGEWIGSQSSLMFLTDTSMKFHAYPRGVPLNDLPTLNEKFNIFTLSAAKAFLDGLHVSPNNQSNLTTQTTLVMGMGEAERQGLTGDKTLGLLSLALSITSIVLYGVLVHWIHIDNGEEFLLANLMSAIRTDTKDRSNLFLSLV